RGKLAAAVQENSDSRAARWQSGFVQNGKSWLSFDEPPSSDPSSGILEAYQSRRREASRTSAGQVELANWCKKQGLPERERAHLSAALDLASEAEQPALLVRLGFLQVGNQWLSRAELEQW